MTDHIKKLLTEEDLQAIARFIEEHEKSTSGEIRVSIRQRRSRAELAMSIDELARKEFHALGMNRTADRSGVLIFLLLEDRQFHILADDGIHKEVGDGTWTRIAGEMSKHFSEMKFLEGIQHGVRSVSAELRKHFPRRPDDKNELPNAVRVH